MRTEWRTFTGGAWEKEINVRDFIQQNYTPYEGDGTFLKSATEDTKDLWQQVLALTKEEREKGGVLDMDTKIVSIRRYPNGGQSLRRQRLSCGS